MLTTTSWHNRYNLNYRLRTKFKRKFATYKKKNPNIEPFTVETKALALNWWGKAWNAYLKNYALNTINLEKGKLNFRCEALADLKINSNYIEAIVLGSNIAPYEVTIAIKPIAKTKWAAIQKKYDGHLELFEKILDNHFPKEMEDLFKNKPTGLIPSPKEITFSCSCPSRNNLCPHTAVALYALGGKIDADPQLLFKLRGVNIADFISEAIHAERKRILKKAKNKNPKIIKDSNLSLLFDIEIHQK
ncbi:MAG: putative Zn finger protein [Lysobacterales bacterium]|jgi:uncharacterized Zn finger protein